MLSLDILRDLYQHMRWADLTVWRAIQEADADLSDDEYLRTTTYHLHATQRAFMNFWLGKEIELPDSGRFSRFDEMFGWARPFYEDAEIFLATLEESDLEKEAVVPWARYIMRLIKQKPEVTNLGQTLHQLALHTSYHRGQINRRLRELGVEPPLVDYIVWLWMGRPAPAKDFSSSPSDDSA